MIVKIAEGKKCSICRNIDEGILISPNRWYEFFLNLLDVFICERCISRLFRQFYGVK